MQESLDRARWVPYHRFGPCFICAGYNCDHREPAVDAAWLEVLGRLQPEAVTLPVQTAAPVAEQPKLVAPKANGIQADLEAMRAYRRAEPLKGGTMQSSLGPGR